MIFNYIDQTGLFTTKKGEILSNTMITCAIGYDFVPNADKF
jgi:hypothetical protein